MEHSDPYPVTSGNLKGSTAVVTGAARGIGRAIATVLASAGARVIVTARSQQKLEAVAAEINASGDASAPTAHPVCTDLCVYADIENLTAQIHRHFDHLDILVNNAGVGEPAPLSTTSVEMWDRHMAVNARAPFLLSTLLVDMLEKSQDGVIVNIGSVVSHKGYTNQGAYTASKHALAGLTKVLAKEFQPRGIRAHLVSPGGVSTEMIRTVRPDIDPERLMAPEEVARAVLFLIEMGGNAVSDEIQLRRRESEPWK